jgi:hypothetical protein
MKILLSIWLTIFLSFTRALNAYLSDNVTNQISHSPNNPVPVFLMFDSHQIQVLFIFYFVLFFCKKSRGKK